MHLLHLKTQCLASTLYYKSQRINYSDAYSLAAQAMDHQTNPQWHRNPLSGVVRKGQRWKDTNMKERALAGFLQSRRARYTICLFRPDQEHCSAVGELGADGAH